MPKRYASCRSFSASGGGHDFSPHAQNMALFSWGNTGAHSSHKRSWHLRSDSAPGQPVEAAKSLRSSLPSRHFRLGRECIVGDYKPSQQARTLAATFFSITVHFEFSNPTTQVLSTSTTYLCRATHTRYSSSPVDLEVGIGCS